MGSSTSKKVDATSKIVINPSAGRESIISQNLVIPDAAAPGHTSTSSIVRNRKKSNAPRISTQGCLGDNLTLDLPRRGSSRLRTCTTCTSLQSYMQALWVQKTTIKISHMKQLIYLAQFKSMSIIKTKPPYTCDRKRELDKMFHTVYLGFIH